MAAKGISGLGVGLMAGGGLVAWSAFNNAGIVESLRALAKGEAPPKHPKAGFVGVQVAAALAGGVGGAVAGAATGNAIADQAMTHRGKHPYQSPASGGGHGSWSNCAAGRGIDCSMFASCALHELKLLDRPLNTIGFLAWKGAVTVPWEQRAAGDLIIWSHHMGIALSPSQMIHTGGASGCPCVVSYSRLRAGRAGTARRVKGR